MPTDKSMPSTIKRSSKKAQETWRKTHDSAVDQYGEGRRAHQTAYASLKHSFEKIGDHWEKKDGNGPSDSKAESSYTDKDYGTKESYGGVDVNGSTKQELIERAKKMDISGYSQMTKDELGKAIDRANDRETAKARNS